MIHKTSCLLLLPLTLIFLDFILISSLAKPTPITSLNVLTYGAKPDGLKDSTKAFLAAWQVACASPNPTTIIVPKGRFLVRNLVFQGNKCTNAPISFRIAGSIIAPEDFRVIASSLQWIMFDGVTNVSIYGGVLDAQGSSLWKCKNSGGKKCPTGAKTLLFTDSNNISIYGLTSINSQKFHIVIDQSNNVKIDGVKVSADADSPNTDGIHIGKSHSVNITNSRIGTGDDCISIGPGSTHVSIQGIQCGPGHGISIYGLTSINSQKFHIVIDQSNNVKIDGVKVSADADSPNTDGIHIGKSHSVNITNSRIGTGDDCISIGPGSTHVSIQGIQCGPGHGISIGSLGRSEDEQGVENVLVSNVDFTSTDNGVRIKTWGKYSKSFVRNIVFQHIKMKMVKNPIIINQHYCLDKPCPKKESGVEISNVRYEDIQGTSNTEVAVMLDCSREKPCTDIVMRNVNLVLQRINGSAQASCNNANGLANDVVVPFTPCLKRDMLLI
uniref:Rhamnogalacturonase A/B/Epimerase-like pectate lyase domain-containing protein n=1 Tax=Brassica campestris TaxID=3711 RepID=M4F9B7_BRACM